MRKNIKGLKNKFKSLRRIFFKKMKARAITLKKNDAKKMLKLEDKKSSLRSWKT